MTRRIADIKVFSPDAASHALVLVFQDERGCDAPFRLSWAALISVSKHRTAERQRRMRSPLTRQFILNFWGRTSAEFDDGLKVQFAFVVRKGINEQSREPKARSGAAELITVVINVSARRSHPGRPKRDGAKGGRRINSGSGNSISCGLGC
jgi:hypothetical protein